MTFKTNENLEHKGEKQNQMYRKYIEYILYIYIYKLNYIYINLQKWSTLNKSFKIWISVYTGSIDNGCIIIIINNQMKCFYMFYNCTYGIRIVLK